MNASRFRWRPCSWVLFLLLTVPPGAAEETVPQYAPVKTYTCGECRRDNLKLLLPKELFPQRGIVLGFGTHLNPYATWLIVDVETHQLSRLRTEVEMQAGKPLAIVNARSDTPLSSSATSAIIQAANALWVPPSDPTAREPRPHIADSVWSVHLFDGDVITKAEGFGPVDTRVEPLAKAMEAAASKE